MPVQVWPSVPEIFPSSSVAEQTAVNRPVGGSNPSWGAKLKKGKQMIRKLGKYESFFAVTSVLLVTGSAILFLGYILTTL